MCNNIYRASIEFKDKVKKTNKKAVELDEPEKVKKSNKKPVEVDDSDEKAIKSKKESKTKKPPIEKEDEPITKDKINGYEKKLFNIDQLYHYNEYETIKQDNIKMDTINDNILEKYIL